MAAATTLSAADLRAVVVTYADLLKTHQALINRLNVYPVPDGDTGTNMSLTLQSVVAELDATTTNCDMAGVCRAVSHGSLMGARGNSGVILSQLLRGLADTFKAATEITPALLADALVHADALARQAVVRPIEGTILSVARAAAEGAQSARGSLETLVRAAQRAGEIALAFTPEQLPVLKQAGVVDSGGTGLLLLLHSFSHHVTGDALPDPPPLEDVHVRLTEQPHHGESDISALRYEVMYLLDADDNSIPAFKEVWAGIGDSIVVVGGEGIYNCHIHTDDIGAALEAALDAGRPREIRVTDLAEQVIEERWVREGAAEQEGVTDSGPAPSTAIVAVVVGDGVGRIFRSLGVHSLVRGGQTMNPSTAELVEAARATGAKEVVILPNNKNIRPVAEQVAALVDFPVTVVPTNSIVEGFAALLSYDPDATAAANRDAMQESAAHVLAGEVTRAVRDTTTDAGPVREGDWIGLSRDGVRAVAESIAGAACSLLDALITSDHELVTIIEGDDATAANTRRITEHLSDAHAGVAGEVHHGGQPLYPYLFGIE
jgi:uncharacterized protein